MASCRQIMFAYGTMVFFLSLLQEAPSCLHIPVFGPIQVSDVSIKTAMVTTRYKLAGTLYVLLILRLRISSVPFDLHRCFIIFSGSRSD